MNNSPLTRHPRNPLLVPSQMPFECSAVFNAGATMFNGKVLLLLRVEDFAREISFHVATSEDGVNFDVSPEPIDYPQVREIESMYGKPAYFDMRITPIDGTYYVCHAVWITGLGCMVGMARTDDFVRFDALPYTSLPQNRNAMLFPEKINGLYARLDRPMDANVGGIWVSYSPDLRYWGDSLPIKVPVHIWNWRKTGGGATPIKTPEGWLLIYHATVTTASTENYYLGAMLVDLEKPNQIIAHSRKFILQPEEIYECVGQVPNVVFTCGAVEMPDGTLNVYYAGADTCMCLAQTTVKELVDYCKANNG